MIKTVKFQKLLDEDVKIYHGDNHNTKRIDIKMMMQQNANNQEGIGIYFSDDISTAEHYGSNVISIDISKKNFVESRDLANLHISKQKLILLLKAMTKIDKDEMFYYMSDYTTLIGPDDITNSTYLKVVDMILDNEVRNLQIELARIIGVKSFVKL